MHRPSLWRIARLCVALGCLALLPLLPADRGRYLQAAGCARRYVVAGQEGTHEGCPYAGRVHSTAIRVRLLSRAQAGSHHGPPLIVVLDPGHGGPDSGAADATGTELEKDLTLQVALRAAAELRAMGYRVYLTRTRDQAVNAPPRDLNHDGHIDQADELDARTLFANRHHADVFVSIHFDALADPSFHGTHGYYSPARPFWRKSRRLATLLTSSISASLRQAGYLSPDSGVQTDVADIVPQMRPDYPWFLVLGPSWKHFVTGTAMPGALIESLFLTSSRDAAALHRPSTIAAIARGYANGIQAYFASRLQ